MSAHDDWLADDDEPSTERRVWQTDLSRMGVAHALRGLSRPCRLGAIEQWLADSAAAGATAQAASVAAKWAHWLGLFSSVQAFARTTAAPCDSVTTASADQHSLATSFPPPLALRPETRAELDDVCGRATAASFVPAPSMATAGTTSSATTRTYQQRRR